MLFEKFETIPELAERWKVPISWIYGETRKVGPDAIPRIRVGKYIRFVSRQVDEWLKKKNAN